MTAFFFLFALVSNNIIISYPINTNPMLKTLTSQVKKVIRDKHTHRIGYEAKLGGFAMG